MPAGPDLERFPVVTLKKLEAMYDQTRKAKHRWDLIADRAIREKKGPVMKEGFERWRHYKALRDTLLVQMLYLLLYRETSAQERKKLRSWFEQII